MRPPNPNTKPMPQRASSTTRHGNGAGVGGPAKGAGNGAPPHPLCDADRAIGAIAENDDAAEQRYRQERRRANRERREKAWAALDVMVGNTSHPKHFDAALATVRQLEDPPKQTIEQTGTDGGPIIHRIERVIIDPKDRNGAGFSPTT